MSRNITMVLNDLNIATRDFIMDVISAINNDNYFSSRMLQKSRPFPGGDKAQIDLRYGRENVQTMDEYGEYTFQPVDMLDRAQYEIKHVHGDMTISQKRLEVQNIGKAADISLARNKSENMSETMKYEFSSLLYKKVADLEATDPDSLIKIVGTANNIVGGINAATEDKFDWNPKIYDVSAAAPSPSDIIDPTSDYYFEKLLRKLIGPLTIGNDKPTLGLTTQGVWDAYEEILRADKRLTNNIMEADGGFNVLRFRQMKIAVDSQIPGGKMDEDAANSTAYFFAVNEKYIGYSHSPNVNFKWVPWKKLERQPVYGSGLDWFGCIWCSRRDRQGAIYGLPTDNQIYV